MTTILDYIAWRGDLPFASSPFNEVDGLVLSQLSYLNYSSIVDESFERQKALCAAAEEFAALPDFDARLQALKPGIDGNTVPLLMAAGKSARFGALRLCGYVARTDFSAEEQFAALTFVLPTGQNFVAFRGTDGTIVGWKEDFNMAFMSPVPAQIEAVAYARRACAALPGAFLLGGHSKGGNLAVYASAFCGECRARIGQVYNYDGPGFDNSVIEKAEFQAVLPLLRTFMPKSSVVGILFDHKEKAVLVESSEAMGVFQHDPFTWFVCGTTFVTVPELTAESVFIDLTLKNWLRELDAERREQFVDTLFEVLEATEAKTIAELQASWVKSSALVIKALARIDGETREAVLKTFNLLLKSAKKNVPIIGERRGNGSI